jgi:hypothetical protein
MPVSFLTAEQERRYGRYAGEPSTDQLARYFHLDDADRELVMAKRWDHMRLGFAVQLGTVRFLSTFLDDVVGAPAGVIADLARQLGIGNPDCIAVYREGRARWQHAREIRLRLGYREFTDPFMRFRLWPDCCPAVRAARALHREHDTNVVDITSISPAQAARATSCI